MKRTNQRAKFKNKKPAISKIAWIAIIASLLIAAGLFYWINSSDSKSKMQVSDKESSQVEFSKALLRANQLTEKVFYYVEMVETKKLTQEEAKKQSEPIKVELQNIRSKLSKPELMYNDSIREVMGNIMVDNVMKWRMDMGIIKPDTIWTQPK